MKKLLRFLKNVWILLSTLWLTSLLACWLLTPLSPWLRDHLFEAQAIVSACFLLVVVLRQYRRIRGEKNLESLLQIEVDRSRNVNGEYQDQQVLRERLKHTIALLRSDRAAGGGGSAALSDLPWYLLIGDAGAGKTSLLKQSGLSASNATAGESAGSTRHCDFYLSPEAVMIDTAGRYLHDDQSASEFSAFLRMLRKQRGKAAINGLVLVVSLPELVNANLDERHALAHRLIKRVCEYAGHLGSNPPIYLMFSKTDQLPGFGEAFSGLELQARQQPLGMTFGLEEIRKEGLDAIVAIHMSRLHRQLCLHVDTQVTVLGVNASSTLINFPRYFAEITGDLTGFFEHFAAQPVQHTPLLRGVYFTSTRQNDAPLRHVCEDRITEAFALQPKAFNGQRAEPQVATGNRGYFITDTFRQVIFPDRDLALYQFRSGKRAGLSPLLLAIAGAGAVALIGWQGWSYLNNRQWLDGLHEQLATLERADEGQLQLVAGQGLELLRKQLETIDTQRREGVPVRLGAGLYQGQAIDEVIRSAYFAQLRIEVLEPITRDLQARLRLFNGFASDMSQSLAFSALPGEQVAQTAGRAPSNAGLSLSEEMLGRLDAEQIALIAEAYQRLKLYLLLTEPQIHSDAAFVAKNLPQAWAAASDMSIDSSLIDENVPRYLQQLAQGQAPSLPRNEALIGETREHLKTFMIASSLVDREYLRLQLEANRQFPPLNLDDLVPGPGRALLQGSASVPAIYTRQGWESLVKPGLIKLVSGNLHNDSDWVLDGEGDNAIVQKANFVREFMARYKRDYAQAWYRMIGSVGVHRFADLASATRHLGLLSDVRHSPVKQLLAAVDDNTRWDLPQQLELPKADGIPKDGFWGKVSGLFDAGDSLPTHAAPALPAVEDGSLARSFEPVSRVFARNNAEGADSTIMDRYLAALRGLKVRLHNVQRAQDVGKSSKQLISETLDGQPSEVTLVRNYVESTIDISQDALSRSLLGLFSLPVQHSWDTLRHPAGQQIAKAWAQQIKAPWERVMANRYPIVATSRNETSVKDLQRFVDPDSGLLPAFKRNEIGNLSGSEALGLGSAKGKTLVKPHMLASIDKASSLGQVIASLSDRENGFEIMLEPSGNFTDIVLTLDGQEQHYRNGRSHWNRFAWPGTSKAPGARLDVVNLNGTRTTVFDFPGRWGLLRMNESARVEDLDGIQQRFSWSTPQGRVSLLVRNFGGVKLTDLAQVKSLGTLNDSGAVR